MDPIITNVRIQRGEILTIIGQLYPVPTDITGWTIWLRIKNNYGDISYILSKAGVITSPLTGEVSFTFSHTNTDITPRVYVYDIWRTDGGNEIMLGRGDFVIEPEVTY